MDIGSGNGYPASALSNFAPHKFYFRGVECNSMEGLLQSFKFKSRDVQKEVCKLVGKAAKFKGKHKKWYRTQILYWEGEEYERSSKKYQLLLDEAYLALFQNEGFRKALKATNGANLTHSMGRTNENSTILTTREFCSRLTYLRTLL